MKAKVVIENGSTEIILKPDNEFEINLLEQVIDNKYKVTDTNVNSNYSYGTHSNHNITITINKKDLTNKL